MHVLVLGSETHALAVAGVAALAGHQVTLASLAPVDALAPLARHGGLRVSGTRAGFAAIEIGLNAARAAEKADFVVVSTQLSDHPAALAVLRDAGTRAGVLLVPGGVGGALAFAQLDTVFVAEVPGFPLLADLDGDHTLTVRAVKRGLPVGALPRNAGRTALRILRELGLDLSLTARVLETSLANTNVLIHPPLVLSNWSRVETRNAFHVLPRRSFVGWRASDRARRCRAHDRRPHVRNRDGFTFGPSAAVLRRPGYVRTQRGGRSLEDMGLDGLDAGYIAEYASGGVPRKHAPHTLVPGAAY